MRSVARGGAGVEGVLARNRKEQRELATGCLGEPCFVRGNSQCKGPEAGVGQMCLRDREEAGVAGAVWAKGKAGERRARR